MVVRRIRPLANDHPEDPASCKWSSGGSTLLQMIIRRIRPIANDHLEGPSTYKWSSVGSGLLQMIIWRTRPLANNHPSDLASCKWSTGLIDLLRMILRYPRHPNHLSQDPYSISWTFLEQFALLKVEHVFGCKLVYLGWFQHFWMWNMFVAVSWYTWGGDARTRRWG